mgnify:CR=1 FL=1
MSIVGQILGRIVVDRIQNGVSRQKVEKRTGWQQARQKNHRASVYTEKHHRASERISGNPICKFQRL